MGYTQKLGLLAQSVFQDSSLNVGIGGAPSGTYKFEVTGTLRNTTSAYFATSSGNVGIGTTSADSKLDIGTASPRIRFWNGGVATTNLRLGGIYASNAYASSTAASSSSIDLYTSPDAWYQGMITFSTNGSDSTNSNATERMRITSEGNILIGGTTTNTYSNKVLVEFATANLLSLSRTSIREYGLQISSGGTFTIRDYTGAGDRLTITSGGKVGISTSVAADVLLNVVNSSSTGYGMNISAGSSSSQYALRVESYNGGTEFLRVRGDGLIGIGISSPSGLLSLKAEPTNTPTLVFQNSLGGPNSAISNFTSAAQTFTIIGTNFYVNSSANGVRFNTSYAGCGIIFDEGILRFATSTTSANPSTRMTITSDGVVQVSKNALSDSVQIISNQAGATSGTTGSIVISQASSWQTNPQGGGTYYVEYGHDSAGLGYRWSTYSGSYAYRFFFYANGTAYNSTGTWGNSSDIKLKQDIVDANPQWDDIKALKFKKYRLKKDVETELKSTDGYVAPVHFGLIAQEVELTSPGLIEDITDADGTTKMIKTSIMLMKSVKALQEAMIKIESLQEQINELKNK